MLEYYYGINHKIKRITWKGQLTWVQFPLAPGKEHKTHVCKKLNQAFSEAVTKVIDQLLRSIELHKCADLQSESMKV